MFARWVVPLAVLFGGLAPAFAQSTDGGESSACWPGGTAYGACANSCSGVCGPVGRLWFGAEYLMGWIKDSQVPPLATAGLSGSAGVPGQPGTVVVYGGTSIDHEIRSGGRFTLGAYIDDEQTIGLEVNYFFLGDRAVGFAAGGTGAPGTTSLARPFLDVATGRPSSQVVALADVVSGSVVTSLSSRLQGWHPHLICNLCCDCDFRIDLTAGFRYAQLDEGLNITSDLTPLGSGTRFRVTDEFETRNYFYGGSVGLQGEYRTGRLFLGVQGSVALGSIHQVVNVRGQTLTAPPGAFSTLAGGGLLALPSNIGRRSRDEFTLLPEAGVCVGWQVTDHIRASIGYSFLYLDSVARPGDQVGLGLDTRQIPSAGGGAVSGATWPVPLFRDTGFWAQGVNVGVELRY